MRRLALLVLLAGCAGAPARVETAPAPRAVATPDTTVVPRHICVPLEDAPGFLVSEDGGGHWSRSAPGASPRELGDPSPGFRALREFRSDDPAHGDWNVWRLDGITWRLIATVSGPSF